MTAYPVLGQARGGTSAVAGILRLAGVHMGERFDGGPATTNHEDVVMRGAPVESIAAIAANRHDTYPRWGWKDPELIDRWRHVRPSIPDARPIVVLRDPDDVAASVERWDGRRRPGLRTVIDRRHKRLCALADAGAFTVHFDRLRADPAGQTARIARHVNAELSDVMVEFVAGGRYTPIPPPATVDGTA